jgi:antagonist of KipI
VSLRVERAGAFTTVQDLGRAGWGASGVPPSGAMDELALRVANLLAGNDEGAAALEMTITGPDLRFAAEHLVALAGAPFDARIDGEPFPSGRSLVVPAGTALSVGKTREGVRGYLAVRGGIDVPIVLGSRSTLVAAGFGGVEGRAITEGDILDAGHADGQPRMRALKVGSPAGHAREVVLRTIPGPQEDAFARGSLDLFYANGYRVSPRSDRAGVRLEGDPIELDRPADLDPEGVLTGAVQVPSDGLPIVLGPDRPATGGYPKIATVIQADLPLLAQARPGDTLRFSAVEVPEARAAWRERLRAVREGIEELS